MSHPPKKTSPKAAKQTVLTIEPGTLVLIISLLILLPLLFTGFFAQ